MFVRKIKSNKGIIEVGRYGVERIDADVENHTAAYYTAGGNGFMVKLKEILNDDKVVGSFRNYHKNLF